MSQLTVILPTSPIPVHPSTEILEKVIASVRRQLPDSEIVILCDGMRPEVEHRRAQYEEYLERVENLCSDPVKYWKISAVIFEEHKQQAGMLKHILPSVNTPNILFIEHDATLDNKPIPWELFEAMLSAGAANTIRLYWHCEIHPQHTHLMQERQGDFVQTTQWSGWPFLARTDFYRELMNRYFPDGDDCKMLETTLYSPVVESPWEDFKTVIYCPENGDGIRFTHLDARTDKTTGVRDPAGW